MRKLAMVAAVAVVAIGVVSLARADEKKTIKQVMKEAHGGMNNSLLARVVGGKGSKDDAEKLLALYKDLAESQPKKGDKEKWKERTEALVKATEAVVAGEKGAGVKLTQAVNCMNCHRAHK